MATPNVPVISPALTQLAKQVKTEYGKVTKALTTALEDAIRCGRLLRQAKDQCKHGEWLPWLKTTSVPERTAQQWMKFAEYEADVRAFRNQDPTRTFADYNHLLAEQKNEPKKASSKANGGTNPSEGKSATLRNSDTTSASEISPPERVVNFPAPAAAPAAIEGTAESVPTQKPFAEMTPKEVGALRAKHAAREKEWERAVAQAFNGVHAMLGIRDEVQAEWEAAGSRDGKLRDTLDELAELNLDDRWGEFEGLLMHKEPFWPEPGDDDETPTA